jgi:CRP-like cAMP-binding protein
MELFKEKVYEKGDMIIRAGEVGEDFFIVKSGTCRIYSDKIDNFFSKLVSTGDYFGEASIIKQEHRLANVVAVE